jgi:outer membrane receptor protein involved in Fe transport
VSFRFSNAIIAVLAFCAILPAQSVRSSIAGAVVDSAGKSVPSAHVSLKQDETNQTRSEVTNQHGEFLFKLLPAGEYTVEVDREGYRKHVQRITLLLNQEVHIEIPLLAGQRSEQVNVSSTAPLTRTDSAAIGGVIDTRQIQGLPLDGRNFYELSLLLPGVVPAAQGSAGSDRGDFAINVNGAREDANNFLLDGMYNGDPKLNGFATNPPVDAIREFEVLTSTYDASFGRNAGAQVNVILRSGTNALHGTVYEFFRNTDMDARNFFAPEREKYNRNQFGASFGGPLVKNRTFLFGDYEGRRVREGIPKVTNVPTLLERTGDFSQSRLPAIDPQTGGLLPGNKLPSFYFNPVGAAVAALFPLPNRNVSGANFVSSPTSRDRDDHFDLRLDHIFSPRSEISARYSFGDRDLFDPFSAASSSQVPGYGNDIPRRAQNLMLGETHVFSPSFLNELRLGFDRVALGVYQQNITNNLNKQVGIPVISTNPRDTGLSLISVTGFSPIGDEINNPQHGVTNTYQLIDQASYTRGSHLLKFGFDFRNLQQNAFRDVESRGFLNFTGQLLGNPLEELLLGAPTLTGVARLDNPEHLRAKSYDFFGQDSFRVRPDLTLILGVRYEYNTAPVDPTNRANLYDLATHSLVQVGTNGLPRGGYDAPAANFAPRIGLAYSPGGKGTTVVRAGYGIYFDQSSLAPSEGLYFSAPYFNLALSFPYPGLPPLTIDNPFPGLIPLPSSATAFDPHLRTPYMQDWNFNIQRQLGKNRMVEIGYVGSKGTHLYGGRDINQPGPSNAPNYQRPNPRFEDINILESRGNSNYNSLQSRFQQRLSNGLSVLASYTFAKSIDEGSGFFTSAGDPNFPQNSYNVHAERGRSDFDVRHRASISYSYDLPGRGRLLGGWQTFGILTFQSGQPFTVALNPNFDNSNTGQSNLGFGAGDRPNLIRNPALSNPSVSRWFDTSAFVIPARGNFGNAGRNILDGPGSQTVNLSLLKNTRITEGVTLQFRAEVFNLLNRANFGLPDNFVGNPTFGQILSAANPRRIQLGLKILF